MYLTFNETLDKLPSTCSETYEDIECYSYIGVDYGTKIIQIKFGEQSINGSSPASDDYYISQETEMWHETYNLQWTASQHKCYHGDLCDFEFAKMKVFQMRQLTTNFDQFQQKLSAALFTSNSGTDKNLKRTQLELKILVNRTGKEQSFVADDKTFGLFVRSEEVFSSYAYWKVRSEAFLVIPVHFL
jgi:hypothetical protein